VGIDDNSTVENLQLSDGLMYIGDGTLGSEFHVGSSSVGGDTRISYGVGVNPTGNSAITFYGAAHSTQAGDIGINSAGALALYFDNSASTWSILAKQLVSTLTTGTAPFIVASTTLVSNLNADTVDGIHAAGFPNRTDTTVNPAATDDLANYQIGSIWINTTDNGIFICTDNTDDAAIWDEVTIGGGSFSNVLLKDGTQALTANWDAGSFDITAEQFHSDIAIGTAPFTVVSTTVVSNLNADQVDGIEGSAFAQKAVANEFTKTQNFNATTLTALGANLVTNGTFDTDVSWTKGTGWTIDTADSNVASSDGTQAGDSDLTQTIAITAGKRYQVTFTVLNYSAGNVTAVVGDTEGTDRAADGTYVEYIIAGAGTDVDIRADLEFVGDIDNVIVKLANVSWDLENNQVTSIILDGNLVFDNPTNLVDGAIYHLTVKQDGVGSRTATWGSVFKWPGGTPPTLSAGVNAIDHITLVAYGTDLLGKAELNYS